MTSLTGTAVLVAEMVALLLGVTFGVALLQRRLGDETIRRWMGGPPRRAALKGIALGFVTPFCTYSAIPVLVGMRQAGVRPAGYAAFIFAAPVVDPVLVGVLALIVGPAGAGLYVAAAFTAAFVLALIVDAADIAPHLKPVPALVHAPVPAGAAAAEAQPSLRPATPRAQRWPWRWPAAAEAQPSLRPSPCSAGTGPAEAQPSPCSAGTGPGEPQPSPLSPCSSPEPEPWRGWRHEAAAAWRRALALLRSMAWLMAVGVGIGVAISLLVPADAVVGIAGATNPLAVPTAAAAGVPLYLGTEMLLPIGDALHAAGAGAGAIVALVIAGAGANIPEFALLTKVARGRLVAAFFAYVFAVAVAAGLIANLLL
jgi:hypothetical protein